jgi:hypothetical protein
MKKEIGIKPEHIAIYKMEQEMLKLPKAEIPLYHSFCEGVYARSIVMKAGTLATGAVHKKECFFIVRSGTVLLTTDEGTVKAESGFMAITKAGSKRAALALEDTLITTFHANPEELREPDEMWDNFTVPAPDDLIEILEKNKLEVTV